MSRKYVYECNECKAEFEDRKHVNVKGLGIFITLKDTNGRWQQLAVEDTRSPNNERHFCNAMCFIKFYQKRINQMFESEGRNARQ